VTLSGGGGGGGGGGPPPPAGCGGGGGAPPPPRGGGGGGGAGQHSRRQVRAWEHPGQKQVEACLTPNACAPQHTPYHLALACLALQPVQTLAL
jgi:hypothetical protein